MSKDKSQLVQLSQMTKVVIDTSDLTEIRRYQPAEATTNPSLILQAMDSENGKSILEELLATGKTSVAINQEECDRLIDKLIVMVGHKILQIIPGRVSTEVAAKLAFDKEGTIAKARHLIQLYQELGIEKERVLIKVPATWESIQAAAQLESEGIHCNITLIFCAPQAIAAAQAKATLISPFVGRISDWYKEHPEAPHDPTQDPGVEMVKKIYHMLKAQGSKTTIMGASFRSISQVISLAGCDQLTISPKLLKALEESKEPIKRELHPPKEATYLEEAPHFKQSAFNWALCNDTMACEKLHDGLRKFGQAHQTLAQKIANA